MAIELVKGGSVTCVDNNYDIYYNGTSLRMIYACDTANNVCTLVYCKPLTVTFNYLAVDTDLSSLNRSINASACKGCCCFTYTNNDLCVYAKSGCGIGIRYNTTLSVTVQDTTPVCTGTCGIYDYCIWTSNDLNSACVCICAYYKYKAVVETLDTRIGNKYSLSPTNKTITSAIYSVNTGICAHETRTISPMCTFCGAGTIISNPSITRTVAYCVTNTVTGETRRNSSGIENEESSINLTFDF